MSQSQRSAQFKGVRSSLKRYVLGFVPSDNVRDPNLVKSSEEGEGGKDDGSNDKLPLVEDLERRRLLCLPLVSTCS